MKREPLRRILIGEKRIESRFSLHRILPHGRVAEGDRIFFKESAGPVRATAVASAVATWYLPGPEEVNRLRELYNRWIRADDRFWEEKLRARWATLIVLHDILPLTPIHLSKRDRRPWVTFDSVQVQIVP